MKISDLYKKYTEMIRGLDKDYIDADDLYSWINGHVNLYHISSSAMLDVIRSINKKATREIGQYKYIDRSSQMIGIEISMISLFTDLEFDGISEENVEGDIIDDYDLAKRMRLVGYLRKYHESDVTHFLELCDCENGTFEKENETLAIISLSISAFMDKAYSLMDVLIGQIENFDPSKIEEAKTLLEKMNKSVGSISDIKR